MYSLFPLVLEINLRNSDGKDIKTLRYATTLRWMRNFNFRGVDNNMYVNVNNLRTVINSGRKTPKHSATRVYYP